jgi:cytochrome c biogenesis protein CcmG, thiol:disulfide interchange protein DsbE
MKRYVIPIGIFVVFFGFLAAGLQLNPREVPSPLINKSAPSFTLPVLGKDNTTFSPEDMRGKVWVLNVWASWCAACRDEHPHLIQFAKTQSTPLLGLDYKDKPEDAVRWLKEFGDPYVLSISDLKGQVGIDYGVYGVPETFVIDKAGLIRLKHIGPLTPQAIEEKILPLIQKLNS